MSAWDNVRLELVVGQLDVLAGPLSPWFDPLATRPIRRGILRLETVYRE